MQVVDVNGNMFGYDYLEIIGIDGKPKTPGGGGGPYVPYTGATGDVDLGEYELKAGQLELDQTPTGTAGVAVMRWNDQDGTADLGLKGGNVTLQVGQEQVTRVVNKTGVDLLEANYQAVRISGAQGNRLKVDLAQANNDANSADTIGIVTETINNNQEGFVTTSGLVRNINTTGSLQSETWLDGDMLYLSGTIAGQITNVKPTAPIHTVIMGYVVRAHATQGQIYVKVDNGYELDELHNVAITSPANNDLLQYDSATSLWKNESLSAAGVQPTLSLTTTGTSGPATLVGATLNIPQYSGGVSSPVTNLGIGTTGTTVTGTTTNTITQSILIPANTLAANNTLDFIARFSKTGTAGSGNYRVYLNTSISLTGATLFGNLYTIAGGANIPTHQNQRTFFYNGTTLSSNMGGVANVTDISQSTVTPYTMAYNSATDYYLIFAIQLGNAADSSVINGFRVLKYA